MEPRSPSAIQRTPEPSLIPVANDIDKGSSSQRGSQPESYAQFPQTVGELRTDRDEDCSVWTPRDALISLLREIDEGTADISDLIVVYRQRVTNPKPKYEGYSTHYRLASGDGGGVMAAGMMLRAAYMMNKHSIE